jgi:hypothetical protein
MTQGRFNACSLSLAEARHRGAATLAAVALALVLAAAGCGGGGGGGDRLSKSEYEQRLGADSQEVRKAFEPLSKQPSSLAELASELKVGQQKLREAADDLDGVKAPKDVQKDNDVLVTGLRKLADEIESLRAAAAKKNPQLVQKALADLRGSHALVDARRATDDMKKKGYKLGGFGG